MRKYGRPLLAIQCQYRLCHRHISSITFQEKGGGPFLPTVHFSPLSPTSNVKCLFTLQKKAIRLICNADRLAHANAMFKDMSILKLSEFVKYKTAIVMFNIFHGTLPIQLQMRFTKYSSVYSTRQTKSFVMVQVRTNLKAMCLSVHGVKLWNTLPDDIKNCTSVNIFKKCIKKHFLSHYIRPHYIVPNQLLVQPFSKSIIL